MSTTKTLSAPAFIKSCASPLTLCPINKAVTLAASGWLALTSATFSFTFSSSSSRVAATASIDFIAAAC